MQYRSVVIATIVCTISLISGVRSSFAALPKYSEGTVELLHYDLTSGDFEFRFAILPLYDGGPGQLVVFYRPGPDGTPERQRALWSGDVVAGDTISGIYRITIEPEGRHEVTASVRLTDNSILGTNVLGGASLFFEVRDSVLLSSRVWYTEIMAKRLQWSFQKYQADLQRRGVYTTDYDSLRVLAPDIMLNMEKEAGYYDDRVSMGENSIDGTDNSGPVQKRGYYESKSDREGKPIPERVFNRPRNPIDISSHRDSVSSSAKVYYSPPIPVHDSLADSIRYWRDPTIQERHRNPQRLQGPFEEETADTSGME